MNEGIEQTDFGAWVIKDDTHISQWVKEHKSLKCDPYLFKWLATKIKDAKVVWDVGANIGDHTRFYLDEGKEVFAFEPNPLAFECLEHNCKEAKCFKLAASDVEGLLRFTALDNVGASRITKDGAIEVGAGPLDWYVEHGWVEPPSFVKIDVEGHEVKALKGMEKTLTRYRPTIFIEVNHGALEEQGDNFKTLKDLLIFLGYNKFEIYPPELKETDPQYDLLCSC